MYVLGESEHNMFDCKYCSEKFIVLIACIHLWQGKYVTSFSSLIMEQPQHFSLKPHWTDL